MSTNLPENPDQPAPGDAVPPPPAPGYVSPPPPAPGYAAPPPPAPGYGAPQDTYPAPAYPAPAYGVGAPLSDSDQRLWAALSHIGGVFISFLVPLVVWLVFKLRGAFVEDQAKESLNFQISIAIGYVVGVVTIPLIIGVFILPLVFLGSLVFGIIATVRSSQGERYRYPIIIRFIK